MMIFTGISTSYWGPIQYTLAFACPIFAFLFSGSSKYADSKKIKLTLFYTYVISLYIMIISMVVQWVNFACWQALLLVPNYHIIATEFGNLIKPAFSAIALFFPLTTFYKPIMWIMKVVNDTKDLRDSIGDYMKFVKIKILEKQLKSLKSKDLSLHLLLVYQDLVKLQ